MRGVLMTILAIAVISLAVIPIQGADADTPARLYFFDADNECIAEVILIPGERLNGDDIPWHGSNKEWYDDDAQKVYSGRTFESGDHIIRAYDIDHPPTPPKSDNGPSPLLIGASVVLVAAVIALIGILVIFKK